MNTNNTILSRVFTQNTLSGLIRHEECPSILCSVVRRYGLPCTEQHSNAEVISEIYRYIEGSYRNEYIYKNTLLNKLLISVHRVRTTVALTEVPIAKSKADFIMINGKAVVYEIKTELDTFERLETQIGDYYKAFDHVCVVTSESQEHALLDMLQDSSVGIYILTKKNTIRRVREPAENRTSLDFECMFKILNKAEYEAIATKIHGTLPNVTPVKLFRACKDVARGIGIDVFYDMFLSELKKRNRIDIVEYETIPYPLRFLVYFSKYRTADLKQLQEYLQAGFEGG